MTNQTILTSVERWQHYTDETTVLPNVCNRRNAAFRVTLRSWDNTTDRFDLFVGGARVGIYKTRAAAERRAAREIENAQETTADLDRKGVEYERKQAEKQAQKRTRQIQADMA